MYLRFLIIALFLYSCDGKPDINQIPPEPEHLLSQEKFTEVMVDVQLLEATLKLKLIKKKDIKQRTQGYYDQIWEKHNISQIEFSNSFEFYGAQAEKLSIIYDSVEVRLIRLKSLNQVDTTKIDVRDILEKKR